LRAFEANAGSTLWDSRCGKPITIRKDKGNRGRQSRLLQQVVE
jgi:hypothetical protein